MILLSTNKEFLQTNSELGPTIRKVLFFSELHNLNMFCEFFVILPINEGSIFKNSKSLILC